MRMSACMSLREQVTSHAGENVLDLCLRLCVSAAERAHRCECVCCSRTIQAKVCWLLACLLNVPVTCYCISGTDLLRQLGYTRCHTEIEVADPTFYLTHSQYTDSGPTSPSTNPIMPGSWQGSHWNTNGMNRPGKNPVASGIRTPDLPLLRRTP